MSNIMKKRCNENEESAEQRKGPWTLEEDTLLTNYIAHNGEGRWNLLAKSSGNTCRQNERREGERVFVLSSLSLSKRRHFRIGAEKVISDALSLAVVRRHTGDSPLQDVIDRKMYELLREKTAAGLKRKGKSCRLRWLNYLKPDIKRGNLTPQEQLLILELHCKWGNRWSKIAQYLPGRTDNEIKNYWRTRVQKQARQLNIDSSSHQFLEVVRSFWVPRLIHKMKDYSNTNSKAPPTDSLGPVVQDNNFSHNSGLNNIDCSTSMSQDLAKISQLMDLSDLETTNSMCLEGSRGSSNQYVNEDHRCLEEEYIVTTMGNSDILPLQDCHVGVAYSTYEEDVTQDPMWNMDDIWQFEEYAPFN